MAARVLIVDDDADFREVLRLALEEGGYTVAAAASGMEALARMAEAELDVVVSDLRMPGLSGLDLLRAVRASGLRVEVVIATGQAKLETAIECQKAGAFDFVRKPFEMKALLATVARAVEHKRRQTSAA